MVAKDRTHRQRLSAAARARAVRFSWKSAAQQMLDVYRGSLSR
jgi:glycosyltransferase involved in cell wall biosynthesis